MLKVSEIRGYPVICLESSSIEGEVKDVIFNLEKRNIKALIIEYGNLIHKTRILDYQSIYSINQNAITVKFKNNLKSLKKYYGKSFFKNKNELFGAEVINNKGNILGFIKDVIFKENDGSILGLTLTNGLIDDMLRGIEVLPMDKEIIFNKDKIIISENLETSILNNIGGLKKLLELDR